MILPRFPWPLDKGDKLRAYHHIRYMSNNHRVILFCLSDIQVPESDITVLNNFCHRIVVFRLNRWSIFLSLIKNYFRFLPFQTAYYYNDKADKELLKLIESEKPDKLFYQLIRTAEYAKTVKGIPKILDIMDPMSKNVELRMKVEKFPFRLLLKMELERLLEYELAMYSRFRRMSIITERDRDSLKNECNSEITIIPNGIDSEYYTPYENQKSRDLLFVGSMSYIPNVEAAVFLAKKVLPLLEEMGYNLNLTLVGANPHPRVVALSSHSIHVTHRVDDTRTYYSTARIFVAPMFINTGLQNKILEAMCMKIPVICTSMANEALKAVPGKHLILADTAEEYAVSIIKLLSDRELRQRLAENAYDFVLSGYSWNESGRQMEELIMSE